MSLGNKFKFGFSENFTFNPHSCIFITLTNFTVNGLIFFFPKKKITEPWEDSSKIIIFIFLI